MTINGAIGGGIAGTVYRYVGRGKFLPKLTDMSRIDTARKSFLFLFLLAPKEGLFSKRNFGQFV